MSDRAALDLSALAAEPADEIRAFNAELRARMAEFPAQNETPVEATRAARAEGRGLFPLGGPRNGAAWRDVPGGGRVRVSAPGAEPEGVFLHVHGGGWTFGAPDQNDDQNIALALDSGWAVASVAYRLAPENPWPAAADDVEAAALWLIGEGRRSLGVEAVAIGGESAGAHLAAVALLRLRARGALDRVAGAVLNYGVFDLRLTPSMALAGGDSLVLTTPVVEWFVDNLTAGDRALRASPGASPLLADLSGFPPTLLQVGTADPLIDDTLFMAARLAAAGAPVELRVWPGGVHGFDRFDLPIAREACAAAAAFLRGRR